MQSADAGDREGVLVLGMHRGGTSALARVVGALGLHAGPLDGLIGASDDNPHGHWEAAALTEFDERLLRHLGGRWSAPVGVDPATLVDLAGASWGDEALTAFRAALPERPWFWKDPRACLLLPFWFEVLGGQPPALVVLRHPLEVAGSLRRRNGFPVEYGLALWEAHLRALVETIGNGPWQVVTYDELVADPRTTVAGIVDFLAGKISHSPTPEQIDAAIASVDGSVRHHVAGAEADGHVEGDMSVQQRDLWAALTRLAEGSGTDGKLPLELPPPTPGLALAFGAVAEVSRFEDLSEQLRDGLRQVREEASRSIEQLQGHLATLEAEVVDSRDEVERRRREVADLELGRDALVESLEELLAERERREEADRHLASLRSPLVDQGRQWMVRVLDARD